MYSVAVAPSPRKARRVNEDLPGLAMANEMSEGIKLCGITMVDKDIEALRRVPGRSKPEEESTIIVEEYINLGTQSHRELRVLVMMSTRLESVPKPGRSVISLVLNRSVLVLMRMFVAQAVVLPTIRFGAEVRGINRSVINEIGLRSKPTVSDVAPWR